MATMKALFLVVSECAWYPVEGTPPSGAYGVDWCVLRAVSGPDALRQAPAAVTGRLPVSGEASVDLLSEAAALMAFAVQR